MKMRPRNGTVLVKPQLAPEKEGSIWLPDVSKEAPAQGHVVAVAEGSQVEVGDLVCYGRFVGVELELEGVKHLLLNENDLCCVLEGDHV